MKKKRPKTSGAKKAVFIALALLGSFLLLMAVFEVLLRAGVIEFSGQGPRPWIPEKYRAMDRAIDLANDRTAAQNDFGFNDQNRSTEKPPGITRRVAILGDSFIWGDGVPYDTIWSHKLEKRFQDSHPGVEVLSWGKRGWSTQDQFEFLKKHGHKFDIDLLVVGFVVNDTDLGAYPMKELDWKRFLFPLEKLFPDASDFLFNRINAFLYKTVLPDYGYTRWMQKNYSTPNLVQYSALLKKMAAFTREQGMEIAFVLTPNNRHPIHKWRFMAIKPLLKENKIPCLDTYPAVYEKLAEYTDAQLQANPADPHPGDLVTGVIAEEVYEYLTQSGPFTDIFLQDNSQEKN